MKKNAIAFCLTANRVFAVASVLLDIKKTMKDWNEEIIIFHDKIKTKDQYILKSILPVRFITYDFPLRKTEKLNKNTLNRFTLMVFAKFESLKLLDDYKTILWLDDDIIIKDDIRELMNKTDSGIRFVETPAIVRQQLLSDVDGYNMNAPASGAMPFLVQDHLKDYKKLYSYCYEKLEQYADVLYLPEQAIFDFMIQDYKLNYEPISYKVYCADAKGDIDENVKIVHAHGQPKFWDGLFNEHWNKNYEEWLKMGGSRYKKPTLFSKVINKLKRLRG